MQGKTHLVFGTSLAVLVVGVGGLGLGGSQHWVAYHATWPVGWLMRMPLLRPEEWPALVLAGGLGSILPDIDQPGSLVTRLPASQSKSLAGSVHARGYGPATLSVHMAAATLSSTGELASAVLGSRPGGPGALRRAVLLLCAMCFAWLYLLLRWAIPARLSSVAVSDRHLLAYACAGVSLLALVLAFGGIAGIVHRFPGHHRGLTHSPPLAIALTLISLALGPMMFPLLRGVGAAFAVGYLSHLAADALTIRGIPLWWPGSRRRSLHLLPRPLRVRTGSTGEAVFNLCWPVLVIPAAIGLMQLH